MQLLDVQEWFMIADEDLDSAKFLTNKHPKPLEIICYHCAQAVEKYLKGFLEYNDVIPEKTHNLLKLLDKSIEIDESLKEIMRECELINKFTNQIRYIHRNEVSESEMEYVLNFTEKIKNIEAFQMIRDVVKKK